MERCHGEEAEAGGRSREAVVLLKLYSCLIADVRPEVMVEGPPPFPSRGNKIIWFVSKGKFSLQP